jgi:hypothetical protein
MTTRVAIFVDTQNVYYTAREVDVVVLVSGDGDFDLLAQKIREVHGKRVEVYGVPRLTVDLAHQCRERVHPHRG